MIIMDDMFVDRNLFSPGKQGFSWIDLSNSLNDPQRGLISRYFPDITERREFLASPEYEEVEQLLLRTIKRKGLYPQSGNGRNGRRG